MYKSPALVDVSVSDLCLIHDLQHGLCQSVLVGGLNSNQVFLKEQKRHTNWQKKDCDAERAKGCRVTKLTLNFSISSS